MSIENRIIQGVDQNGNDITVEVLDGANTNSLRVVGEDEHLLRDLLVQQKITNAYLLMLVGESSKVEESDIEIGG